MIRLCVVPSAFVREYGINRQHPKEDVGITWDLAGEDSGQVARDLTSQPCFCMSSSRPSRRLSSSSVSAATKYNSNPKWRSPYTNDARAKTTLSLVFAEPEEPKSVSQGTAEKHIASMHDALNSKRTPLCVSPLVAF